MTAKFQNVVQLLIYKILVTAELSVLFQVFIYK